jgi:hypothetical protein
MLARAIVKIMGVNGQVTFAKQYAGQQAFIAAQEAGEWQSLHDPAYAKRLVLNTCN